MRFYRLFLVLIFFSASSAAYDEYIWDEVTCDKDINRCALEQSKHYLQVMNELYKKQLDYLENGNKDYKESINYQYDNAELLRESQESFLNYVSAVCKYASEAYSGGSIFGLKVTGCRTMLYKQRIHILKRYVNCRENGCHI